MKIVGTKLKAVSEAKGIDAQRLAQAIERTGLEGDRAVSAVQNWMRGSDHPRCKPEDIKNLAAALEAEVGDIARFASTLKYHRGSPRKAKLLVDLVRGKEFETALQLLSFNKKRAAVDVRKALLAAYNDAETSGADVNALFVTEVRVNNGPQIKRFQPKDRGRAHPILKRMGHITVGLEER